MADGGATMSPTQQVADGSVDAFADTLVDAPEAGIPSHPDGNTRQGMPEATVNVHVDADNVVHVEDTGELCGGSDSDSGSVPPTQLAPGASTPPVNAVDVSGAMQAVVDGLGIAMARASDIMTSLPDLDASGPVPAPLPPPVAGCTGACTHILRQRQDGRVVFLECGDPCIYDQGHPRHSEDDEGHACARCRGRQRVPYV